MSQVYSSDNAGHRVPPHPNLSDPVLASGQTIAASGKDTNAEITVVAGESYAITSIGFHVLGIATTATAANIIWAVSDGHTIVIKIPAGYTSLHYQTPSNTRTLYLRKLTVA